MTNTENNQETTPTTPDTSPQADVFSAVKRMVVDLINKANAIAKDVKASRVDVGKAIHDFRKDPETQDEKIKKYQKNIEKAEATMEAWTKEIDSYIKENLVKTSEMSDEVYEAKKTEYGELKKSATAAQKWAVNIPGYATTTFDDMPDLITLSGGTAGASTGTVRPRLSFLSIDGVECFVEKTAKDGTKAKSYTFTNAAAVIAKASKGKVSPSDLSAAALEAAKVDNLSKVNDVEFSYSVNGNNYMVKAIPAKAAEAKTEDAPAETTETETPEETSAE